MKSEIVISTTPKPTNYPCLKKADDTGCIILFTCKNTGTVIHVGEGVHQLGQHSSIWLENEFTPYPNYVSISNDQEPIVAKQTPNRAVITDRQIANVVPNNARTLITFSLAELMEQGILFDEDTLEPLGTMLVYYNGMAQETVYLQYLNLEN